MMMLHELKDKDWTVTSWKIHFYSAPDKERRWIIEHRLLMEWQLSALNVILFCITGRFVSSWLNNFWYSVQHSSFSFQAGWWTKRTTTAPPSTSLAPASSPQRCSSSWLTAWFRGRSLRRLKVSRREKPNETQQHKNLSSRLRCLTDWLRVVSGLASMPAAGWFDLV